MVEKKYADPDLCYELYWRIFGSIKLSLIIYISSLFFGERAREYFLPTKFKRFIIINIWVQYFMYIYIDRIHDLGQGSSVR